MSGFDVLSRARAAGATAPVVVLSARGAIEDRIHGLDSGADDYIVKPFATSELLARLRAMLRRGAKGRPAILTLGDLPDDPATRAVETWTCRSTATALARRSACVSWTAPCAVRSR